jgi:beta-lysine 5,6-aminomutase alpha subunit
MGAVERLDMMLNDSMYGIIFRDINMQRTFVDQYFSRMINGYAGIIINTGEDNYLTTADAVEAAHTVLASQFINEQFAFLSHMPPDLVALGHAYEINPEIEDSFLLELSQALMSRQIFPESRLKYMPPTKYATGNIFRTSLMNALFNMAAVISNQDIQLLGMLTEAIHTPHIADRNLALENASYIFKAMRHFGEEISFAPDGRVQKRAAQVLEKALSLLEHIAGIGLMEAISRATFADISRKPDGGKGLKGVIFRDPDYWNPFYDLMRGKEAKRYGVPVGS